MLPTPVVVKEGRSNEGDSVTVRVSVPHSSNRNGVLGPPPSIPRRVVRTQVGVRDLFRPEDAVGSYRPETVVSNSVRRSLVQGRGQVRLDARL